MLLPGGSRAAFFLGDGAGVGKVRAASTMPTTCPALSGRCAAQGRQIASIIMDSWLRGRRRHVWVSVSADLMHDAMRDLRDIGAGVIPVKSITDCDYTRIDGHKNRFMEGVLFLTYRRCARASRQAVAGRSHSLGAHQSRRSEPKASRSVC
jgi:hypothetical protein